MEGVKRSSKPNDSSVHQENAGSARSWVQEGCQGARLERVSICHESNLGGFGGMT